jgi:hypothetical protein
MSAAIDQIRKHSSPSERRKIVVKEWGNLELHFGKICGADWAAVEAREPKTHIDRNVYMLIRKAETEDGQKVFQGGDKFHLMGPDVDFDVVLHVINFMLESNYPTFGEAEEALAADPT